MEGFDVIFGFLIAIGLAALAAHLLTHEFRLTDETVTALRQANALQELRVRHQLQHREEPPVDDRRWRAVAAEIDGQIARVEQSDLPVVRVPGGEPQGEVPPLYVFAEMSIEDFAVATVRGIARPEQAWRTPRPRWSGDGVTVRVRANAAFLNGVGVERRPEGWRLSTLPPEYVDREWTLANHRQALGGGGLVTGPGH